MTTNEILQKCTIEGNIVKLPSIKLERKEYLDVAKQLNLIGGMWKGGKIQGFIFNEDPTDLLAQIANGEKRNIKKEFQFFATPDKLADRLVELAEIEYSHSVLEPSAGQGNIVKAIHREFPAISVFGYELIEVNKTFLNKIHNFKLLGSDFLTECDTCFDRIIANPPFSMNQDIDHIMRMYKHLNTGGRIVTVASQHWQLASGKKEMNFRGWLSDVGAHIIELESGTFKESGTNVKTTIIIIDKHGT